MILLTFDLETYLPTKTIRSICDIEARRIEEIVDKMLALDIRTTFFCTGEFIDHNDNIINRLIENGHELANHTFMHLPFRTLSHNEFIQSIQKCDELIQNKTGKKPIGFRAPGGNVPIDICKHLKQMGYVYDSSMCRTYIPGWYEGGLSPNEPYHPSEINIRKRDSKNIEFLEIPLGRIPCTPFPLGGVFLSTLPLLPEKLLLKMCRDDKFHVMYVHPIDLISIPRDKRYIWDSFRLPDLANRIIDYILEQNRGFDMRICALSDSMFNKSYNNENFE